MVFVWASNVVPTTCGIVLKNRSYFSPINTGRVLENLSTFKRCVCFRSVNQMDIPERVLTLYSARFGASEHPVFRGSDDITGYNSPVPKFYGSSGQPPFRFDSGAASETNNEYIDFPGSLSTSFQGPESLVWGSTDDRYSTPKLLSKAATYSSGPSLHIQVVKSESDQRPSRYKPNDQITEFESKISFVPNLLRSQTPIDLTRWSWIYEAFVDPSREELQYVDDKSTSEIDGIRSMQTFSIESRHPQRLMGGSVRYNRMKGPDCITDWWISGLKRSERQNHEAVGYAMELTDAIVAHARTCLMPELLWDSDVPDQSNYLSWKISSVAWQALSCHFPIGFNIDRLFMNRTYISHDPVSLVSEAHRNEVYSAQPLMFMKSSTSQGTSW
ncbi:hypothetical protein B0H10DRAFT_1951728 [Mycena sp. CBHHK59/15]|nr:hypothetical protein B0H10DRAFT_1951728 [Mycena sp. CBHHK59/15]